MNFYPKDFGIVGAGNDTAAVQGAINAIRTNRGGKLILDREQGFNVSNLNATSCSNLEIVADLGCIATCSVLGQPQPLIDLCNSHNVRVDNLVITLPQPGLPGVVYPKCAFLLFGSDKTTFNNVTVNGTASSATLCAIGASSVTVRDSQLINYDPNAPTVMLSNAADWGITSMFYGGSLTSPNMPDWYFEDTEIHQLGGALWTTFLRNADHIVFNGGLSSNNRTAHVLFQGACAHIKSDSQKFYSEVGGSASMVFQSGGGSVTGLTVINPSRDGIPALLGGSGQFYYSTVLPAQA